MQKIKRVFLYGGQGSQVEKMGKDLYDHYSIVREFYDNLDLDFPLKEMSFEASEEEISLTQYTQPIMVAFQIAMCKVLDEKGIKADYHLGLSIGEYGALYGSGVLDENDAVRLARIRGVAMEQAAKDIDTGMVAIIGSEPQTVQRVCQEISTKSKYVGPTNYNCPSQIVISGEHSAVELAKDRLQKVAKKCIDLAVSGPFHTPYMKSAGDKLGKEFEKVSFSSQKQPIIFNAIGDFATDEQIKEIMIQQVFSPIYFQSCVEKLLNNTSSIECLEIGHKNVLKGFLRKIDKSIKVYPLKDSNDLEKYWEVTNV